MKQVTFVPECLKLQVLMAKMQAGIKIGEATTAEVILWPRVEEDGEVVELIDVVRQAIREAVEVAEEREAGG